MAKVNTNISLDPELKKEAVELFHSMGLDLSTAISLFLFQSIRERKITFEIWEVPNETTVAAIKEGEEMMKHPEKSKTYDDVDELFKDLKSWYIRLKDRHSLRKILKSFQKEDMI